LLNHASQGINSQPVCSTVPRPGYRDVVGIIRLADRLDLFFR
jgi:hypothetical protein